MPIDIDTLERLIRNGIPDSIVRIEDLAGDGDHYAATVISPTFKGKTRVEQHKMVYAALQGAMTDTLHALALTTKTSE